MLQFLFMHSLKNALGKQTENDEASLSYSNPSKTFSKSKNGSMWALDPDEEETQQQKGKDSDSKRLKDFESKILSAYERDSTFSEICFFEIIEQIQALSENVEELERLQCVDKAAKRLLETGDENFKGYMNSFIQCLLRRIKKLKKKEKKIELQQYDKIVKNNFKKKSAQFIDQTHLEEKETNKHNKIMRHNGKDRYNSKSIGEGSSSKRNGSASSTEGKLGKLISSGVLKEERRQEENEEAQDHQEESISFTTMISQSMNTRQRKPKESKKEKKEKQVKPPQKQEEGNDEAFIFYRPKVGKKN